MAAPTWLTEQPAAHRGLHEVERGILENSPTAARLAIEAGFAVECDVQLSADGEAMIFHDFTLDRLTTGSGRVDEHTAAELAAIAFRATDDRMPTLARFLDLIGGRAPVLIEIKSRFDDDLSLTKRVVEILAGRHEPIALMSFDEAIVEALMTLTPDRPRGVVAEAQPFGARPSDRGPAHRSSPASLLHLDRSKPDFLAWSVRDLPHPVPELARRSGLPVLTWTVRTPEERQIAAQFADQMIFEGFRP